jgi:hypothetical protein
MTTPTTPGPATAQLVIRRATLNDYYRRAVQTPEYDRALLLHAKATRLRQELAPIPQAPMATSADELDDMLLVVAGLAQLERERAEKHNYLTAVISASQNAIQSVVNAKDHVIASLQTDLDQIVSALAAVVDRLDGARNAAQAIQRGVAQPWQELTPLHDQLDSVWQAYDWTMMGDQRVIHSRSEHLDDTLASDLRIANLDEVFPEWKHAPGNNAIQRWDSPRVQPWPADPIEQLVWLATSGAKLWCPTPRQLDAQKSQRIADRAHPDGTPQQKPQRIDLNQAPRAGYYDRVRPEINAVTVARPVELDELMEAGAEL